MEKRHGKGWGQERHRIIAIEPSPSPSPSSPRWLVILSFFWFRSFAYSFHHRQPQPFHLIVSTQSHLDQKQKKDLFSTVSVVKLTPTFFWFLWSMYSFTLLLSLRWGWKWNPTRRHNGGSMMIVWWTFDMMVMVKSLGLLVTISAANRAELTVSRSCICKRKSTK